MSLAPGVRLGPYEVTALIGEGGMGKVWRAQHTALKRDDALKVLPDAFASDPDRLARFQREAQVLASLNHPNIAHIYGLEQADGVQALVMELVEGPTLADRIARGPIPLDEALPIAKQITEALEAAHEQGIIHRDLKPANIKVRPDGTVKVLDFGLAKALDAGSVASDAALSPTITSPAMVTGVGVLLGTAAYMSPEQARGKSVDKRTDIWAFGCVLYEMLTGRRAFQGEDITDVLAFIITKEPDWAALPPNTPGSIGKLLRRCLEKDRKERLPDIGVARLEIKETLTAPLTPAVTKAPVQRFHIWQRPVSLATAIVTLIAATGLGLWSLMRPSPPRVTRLTITPSSAAAAVSLDGARRDVAITPDGTSIIYVGNNGTQLFVRALDRLEATALSAFRAPSHPFLSADGQWIGAFEGGSTLKKVPINGGPAVTVCFCGNGGPRGATWGADGTIIFADISGTSGLWRVSAAGGEPALLTKPNRERGEADHLWPEFLPGAQAVLFTIMPTTGSVDNAQVAVLDLRTRTQKVLVRGGSHAHYLPSGHLVYGVAGTLRAMAFDLQRMEVAGTPTPVLTQIVTTSGGAADFDVAQNGTLVYVSGAGEDERSMVWVDRQGREETLGAPVRTYIYPRLSPDRTKIAVAVLDQERDIWIWDLKRRNLTRMTFDPGEDRYPVWTPDGRRLVWDSTRAGSYNLFWQTADGTGAVERLTESPNTQSSNSFSPDGTRLVLRDDAQTTNQDLAVMTLDGQRRVTPLVHTAFNERNGEISPDGRWLAYESDESGQFEIYVRPFPTVDAGKWQVSTGGGRQALWARSGRELFYRGPDGGVVRVTVEESVGGARFQASPPTTLLRGSYYAGSGGVIGRTYDLSADGNGFLMIKQGTGTGTAAPSPTITIVLNWYEELKRLVPTN